MELKGLTNKGAIRSIMARQWRQEYLEGNCCAIAQLSSVEEEEPELIPPPIQEILQDFQDVFKEPKGLPPSRPQDHRIPLQAGAQPVNVRPYRYTFEQKNEMEKLIKEMLVTSVIRPSRSPYASTDLLVKKKEEASDFVSIIGNSTKLL